MEQGKQFNGKCHECGEANDHIHLSHDDIRDMQAIGEASRMQGQMEEHMRTTPVDLNDKASLEAHLASHGHLEPAYPHESHEDLKARHDEHHAEMDAGPADEREHHTTMGDSHFHH